MSLNEYIEIEAQKRLAELEREADATGRTLLEVAKARGFDL